MKTLLGRWYASQKLVNSDHLSPGAVQTKREKGGWGALFFHSNEIKVQEMWTEDVIKKNASRVLGLPAQSDGQKKKAVSRKGPLKGKKDHDSRFKCPASHQKKARKE